MKTNTTKQVTKRTQAETKNETPKTPEAKSKKGAGEGADPKPEAKTPEYTPELQIGQVWTHKKDPKRFTVVIGLGNRKMPVKDKEGNVEIVETGDMEAVLGSDGCGTGFFVKLTNAQTAAELLKSGYHPVRVMSTKDLKEFMKLVPDEEAAKEKAKKEKEPKADKPEKAAKEPKAKKEKAERKVDPGEYAGKKIKLLVKGNPKKEGSNRWHRFAKYVSGMTVEKALDAGVRLHDIGTDMEHKFIALV